MIDGLNSSSGKCEQVPGFGDRYCGAGYAATDNRTIVIFVLWCVGFVALSFAWLMTSGRARPSR